MQVVLKSANKDDSNLAREIHHHRQFLHPHIARLYEVIVTESLVWLVLEYCPGMAGEERYEYRLTKNRGRTVQLPASEWRVTGRESAEDIHATSRRSNIRT